MNSERKNYPMKEFWAIFPISSILVIRSWKAKKDHFSILAVLHNVWYLHKFWLQIWIQNAKKNLMKEFRAIFPISPILVISEYYLYFKIYGIYINLGCRFEFKTQKLPYERISSNFSDFTDFGHQVWVCKKRSHLNISCNSKKYGTYINLGCRIEFTTQKLPYERISGNFSDFIDFGHQILECEKRSFLNISCISKCMVFT